LPALHDQEGITNPDNFWTEVPPEPKPARKQALEEVAEVPSVPKPARKRDLKEAVKAEKFDTDAKL
jgi:hypothetical protein